MYQRFSGKHSVLHYLQQSTIVVFGKNYSASIVVCVVFECLQPFEPSLIAVNLKFMRVLHLFPVRKTSQNIVDFFRF